MPYQNWKTLETSSTHHLDVTRPAILVDTREQKPWTFPGWAVRHKALKHGDYSIAGYERQLCIERKSVADLFHSFTVKRDGMVKRLEGMGKIKCSSLIVEGDVWEIVRGVARSQVNGRLLLGSVSAMCALNGVSFILAGDRAGAQEMARLMVDGFIRTIKSKNTSEDGSLKRRKRRVLRD